MFLAKCQFSGSGSGTARSHTPRSSCRTRHEADGSNDGPEEPTTGPSPQGQSYKGRGMRWRAAPFMPNLVEFTNEDETEHDRNSWTPLNYVEQYIDHDLIKNIADCTNAVSLSRSGDLLRTSVDEVYHFFGACILMSCLPYPKIRMYWSRSLSVTPITERFTRDRFFRLRQSLKVLIDDDVPEDLRKRDKFWKVRPFLDRILQGCRSQTRPECVSIDEQMIPFTGACPCRQYLPMKPNPVGIKNFVCATTDGIVLDFDLYQGSAALREQVEEPEGLGLGSLVMARLCKTLHRGTKVYCDRLFTSTQGAEQMLKKELYITGIVMKNRVTAAVQKLPTDKIMQTSGRGTSKEVSSEDGQLCVVKWFDNKPVLMISAVHGTQPEDTCQRWDKKQKKYVSVSRPCIVREYNIKMGGVDLIDRMISYYRMSSRTKKWTIRMLMHFTDLALANSAPCVSQRKSKTYYLGLLQEKNQDIAAEISKLENHITKFSIDEADYLHVVEQNKTLAHDIKDLESQVADYHLLAGTPQYQTDANKLYIEYKRLKIKNDRETERNNNIFKKRARKKKRKK
ncbi:uncharacterized protein LOC130524010 [Takifugu flavidus]|uniref:uncharacterized protein LOC130524010 n=1 Tax=Takifugu flavidus TaxID=433684 RepID=UPI0025441798|nr:uncharacterized protein LOC130524010 [Takifugu flavidus]